MKNIYIGGYGACDVHNEKQTLVMLTNRLGLKLVTDIESADLIILTDTCLGSYNHMPQFIKIIESVLKKKKPDSQLIVSGCLANGLKTGMNEEYKNFFENLHLVPSNELVSFFLKLIRNDKNIDFNSIPFTPLPFGMKFSLCEGCLNNCSFCKVAFMNFPLVSYSLESLDKLIELMNRQKGRVAYTQIFSSNFSLYGVDMYGRQIAHEAIKKVSSVDSIRYIRCGCIINLYPELIDELISNQKVRVVDISLESGSQRIYDTMNRPTSFSKWLETVRYIRKQRPDIMIRTELIAGYPGETVDDITSTILLIKELGLYVTSVWEYRNLPFTASSRLPQHSSMYIQKSKSYYDNILNDWNKKMLKEYVRCEAYVVDYDEENDNYILVYPDGVVASCPRSSLNNNTKVGDTVYFNNDNMGVSKAKDRLPNSSNNKTDNE